MRFRAETASTGPRLPGRGHRREAKYEKNINATTERALARLPGACPRAALPDDPNADRRTFVRVCGVAEAAQALNFCSMYVFLNLQEHMHRTHLVCCAVPSLSGAPDVADRQRVEAAAERAGLFVAWDSVSRAISGQLPADDEAPAGDEASARRRGFGPTPRLRPRARLRPDLLWRCSSCFILFVLAP